MIKPTLFVPVLNERHGLETIMPSINRDLFCQILIVDGQSTDGSAEWSREQGYDVYVQKKRGIRHGYIESWPLIKGEYVITFSPDGNCITDDLKPLIEELNRGNDMVIASRYKDNAKSEDDTWLTSIGNWAFTTLINFAFRWNYTDAMTIYRGYRTKLFYDMKMHLDESYITDNWFRTISGIEPLISMRAAKMKLKTSEILSIEPKRISGVSKLQPFRWGASFLAQIVRERFFRD